MANDNNPHTLIRIDTDSYGIVVSTHRAAEYATAALARHARAVRTASPDAIIDCMWTVVPGRLGKPGARVRY